MRNYSDLTRAQRASNKVIEAAATEGDIYDAERAMLREQNRPAGVAAYFSTLESQASDGTRQAARQAYADSLAASDAYHAAQAEAQAEIAGEETEEDETEEDAA